MQKLETVVKAIRYVKNIPMQKFTYEEVLIGLENLGLTYTEEKGLDSVVITPDFNQNIKLEFIREKHFMITKFEIIHILLIDLQLYYDELIVENKISQSDIEIAKTKLELYQTRGVFSWEDKQVVIQTVLSKYHDDDLIATLMLLKHMDKSNQDISYIERHFTPLKYDDKETNMFIELYNKQFKHFATIDLIHCQVVEDRFELIKEAYGALTGLVLA